MIPNYFSIFSSLNVKQVLDLHQIEETIDFDVFKNSISSDM